MARCARAAGVGARLNVVVADGTTRVAVRYAVGTAGPPSLWLCEDARGVTVASEPMEPEGWCQLRPPGALRVARRRDGRARAEARRVED